MIYSLLQSARLLSDACLSFTTNCIMGIKANKKRINELLQRSLMLVTALTPAIGYDNAASVVHAAYEQDISLKEAAVKLGYITADEFDKIVKPEEMIRPGRAK
jgi:fumarate hydratase class II